MSRDVHGNNSVHSNVANSMKKLGNLNCVERNHEEVLKIYQKCFEMNQAIYDENMHICKSQVLSVI